MKTTSVLLIILGIVIISLSILYFAFQLKVRESNERVEREKRALANEESKRKVLEQYRNKYLNALEKNASNKEMENIEEDKFQKYIDAVKELCDLSEKKNSNA